VLLLGLATLDLHEFVEFQDPPLATCPSLTALMEQRLARMIDAFLSFP